MTRGTGINLILVQGLPKMNAIRWVGKVRLPRSLDSVVKKEQAIQ